MQLTAPACRTGLGWIRPSPAAESSAMADTTEAAEEILAEISIVNAVVVAESGETHHR